MGSKVAPTILLACLAVVLASDAVFAVITVQIGGATRLGSSSTRSRERYHCFWDCDLVGCQLTRDDDECAYDCEKICRPKYDYSGRSGDASAGSAIAKASGAESLPESELKPKSASDDAAPAAAAAANQVSGSGIDNDILSGKCLVSQEADRLLRRNCCKFLTLIVSKSN